ncbi:MAG: phosphoribosylaminoimidazolesuccinocarboxamide synthase [Phycisphaerales bacterium JB039]
MPDPATHLSAEPLPADAALNLPLVRRGKVRDVYALGDDRLLIIATDRLSAFDVVLPTALPGKGRLLTAISTFWLRWMEAQGLTKTHLLSTDVSDVPAAAFEGKATVGPEHLEGRIMIGQRCRVVPVEFIVRGYLEGSGWKDYQKSGAVSGITLPRGLRQCDKLPEPIFTPSTKAEPPAHDEPISFEQACEIIGGPLATDLRDRTMAIYSGAADYARQRGIIIADTKFEFGQPVGGGEPILIDEALTPDSSRFWPADSYEPGHSQPSFDKQFVREYLQTLTDAGKWDKTPPGPELPDEIVEKTLEKYAEALKRLAG